MKDYQVRVIHEKANLGISIDKLTVFMKSRKSIELSSTDRSHLKSQLEIMEVYFNILIKRIAEF